MKKRMLHWMVVLLVVVLASGCGGPKDNGEEAAVDASGDEITIETESSEMAVSKDMENSVEIPEEFPQEILPVYDGLFIQGASKNDDGSFVVIGLTDASIADVGAFYDEALQEANVMMRTATEDSYMNMGDLQGVTYTVSVNPAVEDFGYENSVNLIAMPALDMGAGSPGQTDDSPGISAAAEGDNEFIIPSDLTMPEDYPETEMPVMQEKKGELAAVQEVGGRKLIGYMTESTFDEVYAYYAAAFADSDNFSTMQKGPTTVFMGGISGTMFEVGITENTPETGQNPAYKTLVQVFYY